MERLIDAPPMFPTELSPSEIVGPGNMPVFVKHLRICFSLTNSGEFPEKRLDKEIGAANRERIAGTLQKLRDHGFLPLSVDERGRVRWGVVVKSQGQVEFEKDLPKYQRMPLHELQQLGRGGYMQPVLDNVKVDQYQGSGLSRQEIVKGQTLTAEGVR